ncbi:MAG: choice-of-anchor I family protein [Anaerolineae bacterium]|nr:choice-of-anchor I family protein [Anaerolineae bacterium]
MQTVRKTINRRQAPLIFLVAAILIGIALLYPLSVSSSTPPTATEAITLSLIGRYNPEIYDDTGGAEIVAFDPVSMRLFVVNAIDQTVDILDASDPTNPTLVDQIDVTPYGNAANSVAVSGGVVAAAVEADPKQDPGKLVFFDSSGTFLNQLTVGALPDMVTFSPDGNTALVANEGEPDDDYVVDPEGSVSIVDVSGGVIGLTDADVVTIDFTDFNVGGPREGELDPGIRIFGPGATVAQDLEPEYIAVSADSQTAWVTLQENNGMAIIDIPTAYIEAIVAFGTKDHNLPENALDASDKDDMIHITNWPTNGMYQPDAIAAYACGATTCLVTANEGDARDYDGYSEETSVEDVVLDPTVFPDRDTLQLEENLGRLNITSANGMAPDGEYEALYSFGARSLSIWAADGVQIYDSADDLEQITADELPDNFNANEDDPEFDKRSDNKGPEPEGVTTGSIGGHIYAFVGLERIGGVIVYDVTDPNAPSYTTYINTRNFDGNMDDGTAGDLGPEGLIYIDPSDSPNGKSLLVVAYEVSNTTSIYQIDVGNPTVVELAAFDGVYNAANGAVSLSWSTSAEIGNAGFNIYRIAAGGVETQLNSELIASQSASSGADYSFVDYPPSGTWQYAVEDIATNGEATRHPAITVLAQAPTSANLTSFSGSNASPIALLSLLAVLLIGIALKAKRRIAS